MPLKRERESSFNRNNMREERRRKINYSWTWPRREEGWVRNRERLMSRQWKEDKDKDNCHSLSLSLCPRVERERKSYREKEEDTKEKYRAEGAEALVGYCWCRARLWKRQTEAQDWHGWQAFVTKRTRRQRQWDDWSERRRGERRGWGRKQREQSPVSSFLSQSSSSSLPPHVLLLLVLSQSVHPFPPPAALLPSPSNSSLFFSRAVRSSLPSDNGFFYRNIARERERKKLTHSLPSPCFGSRRCRRKRRMRERDRDAFNASFTDSRSLWKEMRSRRISSQSYGDNDWFLLLDSLLVLLSLSFCRHWIFPVFFSLSLPLLSLPCLLFCRGKQEVEQKIEEREQTEKQKFLFSFFSCSISFFPHIPLLSCTSSFPASLFPFILSSVTKTHRKKHLFRPANFFVLFCYSLVSQLKGSWFLCFVVKGKECRQLSLFAFCLLLLHRLLQ